MRVYLVSFAHHASAVISDSAFGGVHRGPVLADDIGEGQIQTFRHARMQSLSPCQAPAVLIIFSMRIRETGNRGPSFLRECRQLFGPNVASPTPGLIETVGPGPGSRRHPCRLGPCLWKLAGGCRAPGFRLLRGSWKPSDFAAPGNVLCGGRQGPDLCQRLLQRDPHLIAAIASRRCRPSSTHLVRWQRPLDVGNSAVVGGSDNDGNITRVGTAATGGRPVFVLATSCTNSLASSSEGKGPGRHAAFVEVMANQHERLDIRRMIGVRAA